MKRQGSPIRPGTGEGDRLTRRGRLLWRLGHRKKGRAHRYFRWRIAAFVFVHALIAWVPLSGTFRFDFWQGDHLLFGESVDLLTAFQRFVIPFGIVNIGIVLVVRWTGRFLCGWVCPVNFMNRWGDWLRGWHGGGKGWSLGWRGQGLAVGSSLLFAGLFGLWFLDPAVLWEGSPSARLGAVGLWLGLGAISYGQLAWASWRTCKRYCPSGVYFSVLGPKTSTGIERRADGHACEDCSLCVQACPMELEPRDLMREPRQAEGIYFHTNDETSICIRCGDCVEACERFFEPRGETATLRMGFLQGNGDALPEAQEPSTLEVTAASPPCGAAA